jgi:hypothetical protein
LLSRLAGAVRNNFWSLVPVAQVSDPGRLTIIGASTSNGSRCFEPWLPGIESKEQWEAHLAGVRASLGPGSYLEETTAYRIAITLQQWQRLDRYERASTIRAFEGSGEEHFYDDGELGPLKAVLEIGVAGLKERLALAERVIYLASVASGMDPKEAIAPADGRLLLLAAFAGELKGKSPSAEQPFEEPAQWTWGAVQEGLGELATATGKALEKILLAVCRQAATEREQAQVALKEGVQKLECSLVQYSTPLIQTYHTQVLGRLAKLLSLYGQMQANRLGLNFVEPVGGRNGEHEDVHG